MSYYSARDHRGNLTLDADVVVVGSGASGAVTAFELASAGQRVVVLEEGPRVSAADHGAMRASESLRHVWRDGGLTVAMGIGPSPSINVTMGRVVGGSSFITGGVCFRIPDRVMQEWSTDLGLAAYNAKEMEACFEQVEKRMSIREVPTSMRSEAINRFAAGHLKSFDEPVKSIRRNTDGCGGCGRCNFGCPRQAKRSVDLSYLPDAVRHGADVWSHCLVERLTIKGGRAIGVEGRLLNRPGARRGSKLRVHAKRVVVACGAWHTPVLLQRSGVGKRSGQVGRNLTLHPGFRMLARFDHQVRGWAGALQSVWTDTMEDDGISAMALFIPVSVVAATLPGLGAQHAAAAKEAAQIGIFGGIIHDDGGGQIRPGPGREPIVTYRMSRRDRDRIPKVMKLLGESYFAGGATHVFPPILGLRKGMTADEFRRFDFGRINPRNFEVSSQHPLGSARMGVNPSSSVVNADGQVWEVEDLYVVDGSILPTSLGVNPQQSIMSVATRIAWRMREP